MYENGDLIIRAGSRDTDVYLVARGTVQVLIDCEDGTKCKVDELGVGAFLGEMGWITQQPRYASVQATSHVICLCLKGSWISEILNSDIEIAKQLWKMAGCRFAENILAERQPYVTWDRRELRRFLVHDWEVHTPHDRVMGAEQTFHEPVILIFGEAWIIEDTEGDKEDEEAAEMEEREKREELKLMKARAAAAEKRAAVEKEQKAARALLAETKGEAAAISGEGEGGDEGGSGMDETEEKGEAMSSTLSIETKSEIPIPYSPGDEMAHTVEGVIAERKAWRDEMFARVGLTPTAATGAEEVGGGLDEKPKPKNDNQNTPTQY